MHERGGAVLRSEEAKGLPRSWADIAKAPTPSRPLRRTCPFTPSPPPGATDDDIEQVCDRAGLLVSERFESC